MVKRAEELWSVLFCCQNFETKIQTKAGAYNPTQLHTSWYLKAWIQLKVMEIKLQNIIVKFLQGLSGITLVWSHFLSTLMSHSFFTQHEITAAGEKKHRMMSCQTNLQWELKVIPLIQFKYEWIMTCLRNFVLGGAKRIPFAFILAGNVRQILQSELPISPIVTRRSSYQPNIRAWKVSCCISSFLLRLNS